jgi:RNA polymerase sigma-70 factor (ECF subfamily)
MTSEPDDNTLVRECLDGHERAFEVLLLRYQKPVWNAVWRMVRDPDQATDLTQTAFLKAYEQLKTFDPQHKFFSWLYRIAINEAINHVKRHRRLEPIADDWASGARSPEDALVESDLSHHVQEALMKLTYDNRAVLVLRHFEGCSYEEMAAIVGVPEKTVKSRLFSARRQLKELLEARGVLR